LLLSRGLPVILDADLSTAGVIQHYKQFQAELARLIRSFQV
jgi:hypothetical protein